MRYRREDADGDYTFGSGDDTWLINSPEAVAQAVKTRFELWYGHGFLIPQREHRDPVRAGQAKTGNLQPGDQKTHSGNAGR